ncbi:MAG: dienelactone hydrolase [Actinobacteria bacterium]|nr:dienelactone hydrolase [Actinomycetota bacterium]MBW3649078.1 dienelactone hydrolase [Actinomycetota bacterium]
MRAALLLAPGASANRNQPALVAIEEAVTPLGVAVARIDFPYTTAGRKAPDRPPVLVSTVVEEAERLTRTAKVEPSRLVLGGRSMGGRICSMAVAEGLNAAGLVLVSYPLHPPGRPERLRTGHFPGIGVPCLFLSGTRDAFAGPAELEAATAAIPGPVEHQWIDGGDHGLRGRDRVVAEAVATWVAELLGLGAGGGGTAG